ncbi:hypothetical protein HK104_010759 [Borealophlyctis nickersoniae]|nr:hypothetical protein HK104_010759 [Borealophlyctis nickersoniae]
MEGSQVPVTAAPTAPLAVPIIPSPSEVLAKAAAAKDAVSPSIVSTDPANVGEVGMATVLGASAGYATKKIAKTGGLVLGVGFIAIQALAHADLVKVNWPRVETLMIGKIDQDGDGKLTGKDFQVGAGRLLHNLTSDLPSSVGFGAAFWLGFSDSSLSSLAFVSSAADLMELPTLPTFLHAFYQVAEIYTVTTILHRKIPIKPIAGYVCDWDGKRLEYRLNGLRVLLATVAFYAILSYLGIKDPSFIADNYLACCISACIIGLLASIFYYVKGLRKPPVDHQYRRCVTVDMLPPASIDPALAILEAARPLRDYTNTSPYSPMTFYLGWEFNPRVAGMDIKMMLYMWGTVALELVVLSSLSRHMRLNDGHITNAMWAYTGMFSWFVLDYMFHERIHLYTYDLFGEKVGFKLLFGCLFFYPFFYPLGSVILSNFVPATPSSDLSRPTLIILSLLFLTGWIFTRGPNHQKFHLKANPDRPYTFLGLIPQRTLPDTRILISGFWGLSRHLNYFGEILQAVAIGAPIMAAMGLWPAGIVAALYPAYYVALFVPREREDGKMCRRKYGKVWDEYCQKVPWRIVPFVY